MPIDDFAKSTTSPVRASDFTRAIGAWKSDSRNELAQSRLDYAFCFFPMSPIHLNANCCFDRFGPCLHDHRLTGNNRQLYFFSILCVVESSRDSNELLKNITVLIVQLKYRKRFSKWLQVTVF